MDELVKREWDAVERASVRVFPPFLGTMQDAEISKIISYGKMVARIAIRMHDEMSRSVEQGAKEI
jgi:hypothetical protein